MRSRKSIIIAAAAGAAVVLGVGAFVIFGRSGDETPAAATTSTATTAAPSTTALPEPTTAATTTTVPFGVTLHADGKAPALEAAVSALYAWMVDPDAPTPLLPTGMAAHLEPARITAQVELTASVAIDKLADRTRVAVVQVGDDVILAVTEEGTGTWEIVGAKMTSFGLDPWYGNPIRHVLVIGTDARLGESQPDLRADSIHIVAASLEQGAGGVVGFPRDTYVATSYGHDKFSSVNVRGDTQEVVQIAEELSGIELDGYILTGFSGFKHLVNGFGGVEVDVPFRMSDEKSQAFLDAGLQVLKGRSALAFSRNRHISGGDFTRCFHQGIVIKGGLTGARATGIGSLPGLLSLLDAYTWTDLSAAELLQLGAIAYELDPDAVGNVVLPGTVGSANGASVVRLTSGADDIFEDLIDGVITDG